MKFFTLAALVAVASANYSCSQNDGSVVCQETDLTEPVCVGKYHGMPFKFYQNGAKCSVTFTDPKSGKSATEGGPCKDPCGDKKFTAMCPKVKC